MASLDSRRKASRGFSRGGTGDAQTWLVDRRRYRVGALAFGVGDTPPKAPPAVSASSALSAPVPNAPTGTAAVQHSPATPVASSPAALPPSRVSPVPSPVLPEQKRLESKSAKVKKEVLTAATIAALIVAPSRRSCHASGRLCACPDDRMRNGRKCGGNSAYSRPGGAAPLCYSENVSGEMIDEYRRSNKW